MSLKTRFERLTASPPSHEPDSLSDSSASIPWAPIAVFLVGVAMATALGLWKQRDIHREAQVQFQYNAQAVVEHVSTRLQHPIWGLQGVRGLFAASNDVERAEFRAHVESRDMDGNFVGVRGFGFIQRVLRPELGAFLAAERADGAPQFALRQLADKNHDDLYIIKFIEPAANNVGAQGLDVGSEANRRDAAQRAVDSGQPSITAAITLVQDQHKTPGVLLFLPIYVNGTRPTSVEERRASLRGLAYAPLVMAELLEGMTAVRMGMIDFELFDGPVGAQGSTILFDSDRHTEQRPDHSAKQQVAIPTSQEQPTVAGRLFSFTKPITLVGRDLSLRINSTPGFEASIDRTTPWMVFGGSTLLCTLIALMLRQQTTGRRRAEARARDLREEVKVREHTEWNLREAEKSFKRAEFLKEHAMELARAGHWSIDFSSSKDFYILSDRTIAIFGDSPRPGHCYHMKDDWLVNIAAVDPAAAEATFANFLAAVAGDIPRYDMIHPYRRPSDGQVVWIHILGEMERDEVGKVTQVHGVVMDVTAFKRAEEAERAASRAKSDFLANMSHEIRTPLNAVLGLAQVGLWENHGTRSARLFRQMLDSGQLLLGIINDILDFSKVEAGKLTLESEPISRQRLIDHLLLLGKTRATEKGIGLRIEQGQSVTDSLPEWFEGDFLRITQVLGNLISNAIKFTERGEVVVSLMRVDGMYVFQVRDTGIGLSEEQCSRLFSAFEQADASTTRKYGGTGLGLTISKQLVTLMGGAISVSSQLSVGSTFEVRLPLKEITAPLLDIPDAADKFSMKSVVAVPRLTGIRILAAEDNPVNQLVLEDMLMMEGATLVCVEDGLDALDLLKRDGEESFDILLTDIQMPRMDGYQLAEQVCQIYPTLPIIGLTAHAMAEERARCFASGMVAHITKPIDLDTLVVTIDKFARRVQHTVVVPVMDVGVPATTNITDAVMVDPAVIDLKALLASFNGRQAFIDKLVATTLTTTGDKAAALREAAAQADYEKLALIAHALKGVGANMHAGRVHELCKKTDDAARGKQFVALELAEQLAQAMDELLAVLMNLPPV